ncbi:Card1-like endonuclease domain-containing protein [Aliiruegeria sabulilitoris]|uniref:Card1-like endonuclease domain-containing protein n=1 Tax=Aliiruegeria sabulilitoris TaxID=1510458 RepID=UPI000830F096|nr:DUF1887 family CARF protein [Aliiruegeria sabulilitoris]
MIENRTDWPERFVYIVAASKSPTVTLAPIIDVPERIAGVIVLEGISNLKNPTQSDIDNAGDPARKLQSFADRLGVKFRKIRGSNAALHPWTKAAGVANEMAGEDGDETELVFNMKAGQKEVTIGVLAGYNAANMRPLHLHSVTMGDSRPTLATLGDHDLELRRLPVGKSVRLDEIIRRHDHDWTERQATARDNQWRLGPEQCRFIDRLTDLELGFSAREDIIRAMNSSKLLYWRPAKGKMPAKVAVRWPSGSKWVHCDDWIEIGNAETRQFLCQVDGAEEDGTKIRFRSKRAWEFLKGGWLETYVYRLLIDALDGVDGVTDVEMSVRIAPAVRAGHNESFEAGEIDVAVAWSNRILPIECKATLDAKGQAHALRQAAEWAGRMAGPGGVSLIVMPFIHEGHESYRKLLGSAKAMGVTPVLGWNEVGNVGSRVREMLAQLNPK